MLGLEIRDPIIERCGAAVGVCPLGRWQLEMSSPTHPSPLTRFPPCPGPAPRQLAPPCSANKWASNLGLQREVLFLRANATITLEHTLAAYPAPIDLVCVQFPDPHFKSRHK